MGFGIQKEYIMNAILVFVTTIMIMCVPVLVMGVFALIAEYMKNPVIDLVEELRKKYSNTNEN